VRSNGCPAKLFGDWSDMHPLGRTKCASSLNLRIVPFEPKVSAANRFNAMSMPGMPAASMLDRLAVPTLYPPDLGERFDMPSDLRRISGLSPPWRGSSVG
jgi:hypothetical protein